MMLKGKQDLVQQWILENKGSFETNRGCNIPEYQAYGKTIRKRLFATYKEPRYIHLYHSTDLEAHERGEVEKKQDQAAGKFVLFEEKAHDLSRIRSFSRDNSGS